MPAIDSAYYQKALQRTSRQVLTSGASEAVPDSSEFTRQLLSVLERNGDFVLDPYTMYDRIRLGVTRTSPLFGSLPGQEQGACFALFLRDASPKQAAAKPSQIAPAPRTPAPSYDSAPSQGASFDQSFQGRDTASLRMNEKEQIRLMLFEKSYLDQGKREEMRGFSSLLGAEERKELYEKNKYSALLPSLGNTMYGLGSWLQGDILGGSIVSGTMILGLVLVTSEGGTTTTTTTNSPQYTTGMIFMTGGMIFGWIRPSLFASKRNKLLREALSYY